MSVELSIIIPTCRPLKNLTPLFNAFSVQASVDFRWEVIIVDNSQSDSTNNDWFPNINKYPFHIVYVKEKRPGLHYARHSGAQYANGEYLAYIDDDEIPYSSWITAALYLLNDEADAIGGKVLPLWENSPPSWIDIFWNDCPNGRFCAPLGLIELGENVLLNIHPFLIFGGNFFISKKILINLKGFHPDGMPDDLLRFRGDGENALMVKLLKGKYRNMYDPNATVSHLVPKKRMTIPYFKHRHYIQGISDSFSDIRVNGIEANNKPSLKTNARISEIFLPVWEQMVDAYNKGWYFHRSEVLKDQELMKFVMRNHFWDDLKDE